MKIEIIHVADVQIHMRSGSVERGGLRKRITGRRLGMLVSLAMNVGQVVTKDQLWGASHETARCSLGGGGRGLRQDARSRPSRQDRQGQRQNRHATLHVTLRTLLPPHLPARTIRSAPVTPF